MFKTLAFVIKPRSLSTFSKAAQEPTQLRLLGASTRTLRTFHSLGQWNTIPQAPTHARSLPQTTPNILSRNYVTAPSDPPFLPSTSFADPDRPDLFYHLFEPPTPISPNSLVFALSFLPTPPSSADSAGVLGWLPAEGMGEEAEAGLNDFKENPKFLEVMHEAIQSGLRDGVDDIQINGAIQTRQGWMHIHDSRNVPALGRIGDPDDIIASVRVEEGKILADTYQPMPSYRLCTSDGILQLTDGLSQRLKEVLTQRANEEKK